MKLKLTVLAVCLLAIVTSCDELDGIAKFNWDQTVDITVPATTVADSTYIVTSDTIAPSVKLNEDGHDISVFNTAMLNSMTLKIITPDAGNFNWAQSGVITLERVDLPDQPIVELARIDNVDADIDEIIVPVDKELIEILKEGSYIFKFETTTKEIIPVEHIVKVTSSYTIG